jgi:hypothetical protein
MTFTDEMIAVAVELLTEFGFSVTIRAKGTPGSYNPATLTATETNTTTQGLAAFFDPANSNMSGYEENLSSDVLDKSKWLYVQTDGPLNSGDVLEASGGAKYKINSITAIGPTDVPIIHRVRTEKV